MSDGMPSSINKSMFHQLIVIIIPGALVVLPFCMAIYLLPSNIVFIQLVCFLGEKNVAFYSIISLIILLVGMILENIGSWIEDAWLDKPNNVKISAWNFYLFSDCGDNKIKVFHKYVDSIAFRYKFELSLIPALSFLFVEWLWILHLECNYFNCFAIAIITSGILLVLWFTWAQAKTSCRYLNKLRCAFMAANIGSCEKGCQRCKEITNNRCKSCGRIKGKKRKK